MSKNIRDEAVVTGLYTMMRDELESLRDMANLITTHIEDNAADLKALTPKFERLKDAVDIIYDYRDVLLEVERERMERVKKALKSVKRIGK